MWAMTTEQPASGSAARASMTCCIPASICTVSGELVQASVQVPASPFITSDLITVGESSFSVHNAQVAGTIPIGFICPLTAVGGVYNLIVTCRGR
jgi:hypothetical protein